MSHGLSVLIRCPKYYIVEELLNLYKECDGAIDIVIPTKSSLKKLDKNELVMKYQTVWNKLQEALKIEEGRDEK